jgi:hypothetical protein
MKICRFCLALLAASSLFCTACGSDQTTPEHAEDPAQHACEHRSETGTSISAASDRTLAPAIAVAEEPYTVLLPAGVPGYVKISPPLEGLLLLGTADVVTGLFRNDETTSLTLEASPNEFCPNEIPEHYDLDLHSGNLTVRLGPAAVSDVWLALTAAAGHAH